jgi:hypothetical protein
LNFQSLIFSQPTASSVFLSYKSANGAFSRLFLAQANKLKAELTPTFIQQPGVDWEHLTRASLLLLQQLLQILTTLPQSNPTLSNEHIKVFFYTIQTTIQEHQ